jgi:di/tricarboxylate transporter
MGVLGWIVAVILVAFMLPLLAWMYLDVLVQKQEVKQQTEQIERLRRKIERKENDKKPISISDNPVYDRVRRPLSLSLPRPKELE